MVSSKVLQKIGVFALAVTLAAVPVMAVNAAAGTTSSKGTGESDEPSTPAASSAPAATTVAPATTVETDVVTTDSGVVLNSTVPGYYVATVVDGVAVTTPKAAIPEGLVLAVTNSFHGSAATKSLNDGLALLAANGIEAVHGPEVDVLGYIKGSKTTDLSAPITVVMGVPASFRQAGYDYAVLLIQEGGRVSVLPDKEAADPSIVAVETQGLGVYVLIKAPAGSFDSFK